MDKTNIVMWDVLSADFDVKKTPEDCFDHLMVNTRPGAIVVFHDSERAAPRLLPILRALLGMVAFRRVSLPLASVSRLRFIDLVFALLFPPLFLHFVWRFEAF